MIAKTWPIVVAHRGASSTHPENTLASFEAALEAGADVVELDVRLTADRVPVVLHDPDVARTTDGAGLVHELTLDEVRGLDASGGRGPRAAIPTLHEVLDALGGRIGLNLELKNIPGEAAFDTQEGVAESAATLVRELGLVDDTLFSSFNWAALQRVRELGPDLHTGLLTVAAVDPPSALEFAVAQGHGFLLPQSDALWEAGEAFVAEAHGMGVRVGTWVLDDPEDVGRAFAMGVDAVATNDPMAAVPVRDRFRPG
jgi:glycerophosphoryl diester phosphodiesterase